MVVLFALQPLEDLDLLLLVIGKPGLVLAGNLKQGRLGDIHIPRPGSASGSQPVEHGQDQRPDLEAVHIGIGTDDDLVPAQIGKVKGRQLLRFLALDLHAAAQDLHQVRDDLAI